MRKPRWTETEVRKLCALKESGMSNKNIALVLGKSRASVAEKWRLRKEKEVQDQEEIKECPLCHKTTTVGRVKTIIGLKFKSAYYCSDCLLEFTEETILEPLLI